jgi:hypothetical protein
VNARLLTVKVLRLLAKIAAGGVLFVALMYFGLIRGCTTTKPKPPPPPSARNVLFEEWSAWQSWRYTYRFDATPQICQAFAVKLIKQQSFGTSDAVLKTNVFEKVPVRDRHLPPWFDVTSVTNGLLLTDGWSYAVVDRSRGRLYYYNSH